MGVARRRVGKPVGWADDLFTGVTILTVAGRGAEVVNRGRASQPFREEGRHHMIANLEFADSFTDGFHNACAIRHRDALIFGWDCSHNDLVIVKVKRAGMNAHPYFAPPRLTGLRAIFKVELFKTAWFRKKNAFHQ